MAIAEEAEVNDSGVMATTATYPIPDSLTGLPVTGRALAYAQHVHAGQTRADGAPFIVHPVEVACLLHDVGAADHVVAAGVLHDVIEKTDVNADDLRGWFGSSITALVVAVSEDKGNGGYSKRKAALRRQVSTAGSEALTVFAADKLAKARELSLQDGANGDRLALSAGKRTRHLAHYRQCLSLLEHSLGGSPLVAQLRAELGSLGAIGGEERRHHQPDERHGGEDDHRGDVGAVPGG
jgi:(p)ppGpp synthase/HD superfamily hydrolase